MKIFLSFVVVIVAALVIVYLVGPKPAKPKYDTQLPTLPELADLPAYIAQQEAKHKVKPGNEAEIVWADSTKSQSEYALVYLHGFSASKQEGNPAYNYLAKALHANMYLARLADHGLDTVAPMQYLTADRLWESAKQAYAIGKRLGKK